MSERALIPVYRALLPRTAAIVPYLERMDAKRWYTNRGELVQQLEARLGERIGTPVMSAANGTVAIEAAILATAGRATSERPLALLPAYTFVATASAVEACGYRPYLLDVDETTWSLACSTLDHHPALASAGIVVPVSPYGRAIAQEPWAAFSKRTQIPVVIDAAAAFQSTKAFSSGEGGAVVWSDEAGLKRIAQALNFGFLYKRESTSAGTNGKMSEYHAAVGLAALDAWESTCAANRAVADAYRTAAHAHGISERLFVAPDVASNYAIVDAGSATLAIELIAALNEELIESRLWYGSGLQAEPYWRDTESDALHITERIAPALVGLPMAPDLDSSAIARIVEIAARTLSLKLRQ
jgi:dTDP-4-amino-4,6-dideoxygalactose transaminase